MILTVKQRLLLGAILPNQGDFTTLKIITKLQQDLSFSEEEHKLLQFSTDAEKGFTHWNAAAEKDVQKDVPMGEKAQDIIKDALKKLNSEKRLQMDQLELYEKFCSDEK
jgi:hypothetical protein